MKIFTILSVLAIIIYGCASGKQIQERTHIPFSNDLDIITPAEWGGSAITDSLPVHEISKITIHHGGVYFSPDSDAVAYIRELQAWSRNNKHWIDIPYHYMIDFEGKIYEARPIRFPGDTNTSYDPRGHALICVIGNFEKQHVNDKQLNSLSRLIARLMKKYHVPLNEVKTHRDYAETLCPGKNLYRYFQNGSIQKRIKDVLSNK